MPAALLPPEGTTPTSDDILGRFIDYTTALGLELYAAQEEAIFEILAGKHVVLTTPTGSGKSLVATLFLFKALSEGRRGFWSCPVKALVNEKFFDLCAAFGPDKVGLMTGDASVNRDAPILCGTAEILANMTMRGGDAPIDYVVMDEFHYYADRERGMAWQLPLIGMPKATFLLMSATLGDTRNIEKALQERTNRPVSLVRGMTRPVPLEFTFSEDPLHETIARLVKEGKAPIYLVNFTQRAAADETQNLMSVDFSSKEEKDSIKQSLHGTRFDSPFGKDMQKLLRHGLGLHHAGLLPRYRRLCERLAQKGMLKVVSGTDTLGVGVNVPIRTVLFTQLCKYDGQKDGVLTVREFLQIAGRAGRKGFDNQGYVVAQAPAFMIENKRMVAKAAASGKKVGHKQRPPEKGYVHWDKGTFEKLIGGSPEALESRFTVTFGLLLGCLQGQGHDLGRGAGYRRLLDLVARCHETPVAKHRLKRLAAQQFRTLRRAGLVQLQRDERARCPYPVPSESLQKDFTLMHTLSLYLVDTLPKLDRTSPTYPLDVLSLVEAILENPRPVLLAQLDRLKGETIERLKAEGMEYEQRMEELEKLEWPKPNRDFIYATFNDFSERHPWVGNENISPKGVAAEIVESFCGFHDYVRDYGLQRVEGVLLRYLTQVYKTLGVTIPPEFQTAELEDLTLTMGGLIRGVDASLLEEWEALRDPDAKPTEIVALPTRAPVDPLMALTGDPRAFAARIRTEIHRVIGALARKRYDDALEALRSPADAEGNVWTADRLKTALAPYYQDHSTFLLTPEARHPRNTTVKETAPLRYEITQRLVDPEGHNDWVLTARVDLQSGLPADGPLIELDGLG